MSMLHTSRYLAVCSMCTGLLLFGTGARGQEAAPPNAEPPSVEATAPQPSPEPDPEANPPAVKPEPSLLDSVPLNDPAGSPPAQPPETVEEDASEEDDLPVQPKPSAKPEPKPALPPDPKPDSPTPPQQPVPAPEANPQVERLQQQVEQLEAKLDALLRRPAMPADLDQRLEQLQQTARDLDQRLEQVERVLRSQPSSSGPASEHAGGAEGVGGSAPLDPARGDSAAETDSTSPQSLQTPGYRRVRVPIYDGFGVRYVERWYYYVPPTPVRVESQIPPQDRVTGGFAR